jgi:hypothetical protein
VATQLCLLNASAQANGMCVLHSRYGRYGLLGTHDVVSPSSTCEDGSNHI